MAQSSGLRAQGAGRRAQGAGRRAQGAVSGEHSRQLKEYSNHKNFCNYQGFN